MEEYFKIPYSIGTYLINRKTNEIGKVYSYVLNNLGLEVKLFVDLDKECPKLRDIIPVEDLILNWEEYPKENILKR